MFEEQCLVCGKPLDDDAQAYCSEDCQSQDVSSPSISSASSAVSSPNLGYATGGEVPALIPSALGAALSKYRSRHHYSLSSSSASSWSALTDDEDEPSFDQSSYHTKPFYESADSLYDGSSMSANYLDTIKPSSALSYTRRPSGTNNRSTVPHPHSRTSSTHIHTSAPLHSHFSPDDDGGYSDVGFSSRDESEPETHINKSQKSKRSRASLPAYFSLLQISTQTGKRSSPVSSSSGNTIPRTSPPTPKLPLPVSNLSSVTRSTPRGRRRVTDTVTGRYSGDSSSRSPSRSRRAPIQLNPGPSRSREADDEDPLQLFSGRGRPATRRNSSPPPAMMLSAGALDHHNRVLAAAMRSDAPFSPPIRGRTKVEVDVGAPGYGIGRSGLLRRERATVGRAL